jgi:GntR family transcriptional regulator, transcriptional repressor for pyruvate dehydrogenase complex
VTTTNQGLDERLPARFSRVDEVATRLRARILGDALAPGSRLGTKDELARRYGVSLGTLNGAVRVLAAQKIAESRPGVGGGVFVSDARPHLQLASVLLSLREHSDPELVASAYVARLQLDVLLARLAAQHRTDEDIESLRQALASMRQRDGDMPSTWGLHDRIAEAAHAPVLLAMYRTLVEVVEGNVAHVSEPTAQARSAGMVEAHLQRHRDLAESIIAADRERATLLAEEHGQRLRQTTGLRGAESHP